MLLVRLTGGSPHPEEALLSGEEKTGSFQVRGTVWVGGMSVYVITAEKWEICLWRIKCSISRGRRVRSP